MAVGDFWVKEKGGQLEGCPLNFYPDLLREE